MRRRIRPDHKPVAVRVQQARRKIRLELRALDWRQFARTLDPGTRQRRSAALIRRTAVLRRLRMRPGVPYLGMPGRRFGPATRQIRVSSSSGGNGTVVNAAAARSTVARSAGMRIRSSRSGFSYVAAASGRNSQVLRR